MAGNDRQSTFSGTKEVAERLRFDVDRLEAYMRGHVGGFAGPITLSQFKGGQSNPTYLSKRRGSVTCCAGSLQVSCCRRRMRSIASIA